MSKSLLHGKPRVKARDSASVDDYSKFTQLEPTYFRNDIKFNLSTFMVNLRISKPNETSEKEAEMIAGQVLDFNTSAHGPSAGPSLNFKSHDIVEQACSSCSLKNKSSQKEGQKSHVNKFLGSRISGKSLDSSSRELMELKFGYDFSSVRVHDDSQASRSARKINALAYTIGNHIFFNKNSYSFSSDGGKRLLAHELAHVVQQSGSDQILIQRSVSDTRGLAEIPLLRRSKIKVEKPIELFI